MTRTAMLCAEHKRWSAMDLFSRQLTPITVFSDGEIHEAAVRAGHECNYVTQFDDAAGPRILDEEPVRRRLEFSEGTARMNLMLHILRIQFNCTNM